MRSHSVTCHPTQVNTPRLNPSQTGQYSIYLPQRDGRLSWPTCRWLVTYGDGLPAQTVIRLIVSKHRIITENWVNNFNCKHWHGTRTCVHLFIMQQNNSSTKRQINTNVTLPFSYVRPTSPFLRSNLQVVWSECATSEDVEFLQGLRPAPGDGYHRMKIVR